MEDYLRDLSDSFACAGWLDGIEFVVWCLVTGDHLPVEDTYGFGGLTSDDLADLRFLSDRCQSWPYWDQREQRVCLASLTRWQHIYREWYERQRHKGAA